MLKETVALEVLRQKIEKAEYDVGSSFDYLDYGKPNESQAKAAKESIAKGMKDAEILKVELHALIEKSPKEAVEEWVNWHRNVLLAILIESEANTHEKARTTTAQKTLADWNKVLKGEKEYVGINWHFLKDYKAKAAKEFKNNWWKFW